MLSRDNGSNPQHPPAQAPSYWIRIQWWAAPEDSCILLCSSLELSAWNSPLCLPTCISADNLGWSTHQPSFTAHPQHGSQQWPKVREESNPTQTQPHCHIYPCQYIPCKDVWSSSGLGSQHCQHNGGQEGETESG